MKQWEFTNLVETAVCAELPQDWPDKPESKLCPEGWMLLLDAECDVVAIAPRETALMLTRLLNDVETKFAWEPLE
jgi:hypothetical protein